VLARRWASGRWSTARCGASLRIRRRADRPETALPGAPDATGDLRAGVEHAADALEVALDGVVGDADGNQGARTRAKSPDDGRRSNPPGTGSHRAGRRFEARSTSAFPHEASAAALNRETPAADEQRERRWRPLLLCETSSLQRAARPAAHCSLGRLATPRRSTRARLASLLHRGTGSSAPVVRPTEPQCPVHGKRQRGMNSETQHPLRSDLMRCQSAPAPTPTAITAIGTGSAINTKGVWGIDS